MPETKKIKKIKKKNGAVVPKTNVIITSNEAARKWVWLIVFCFTAIIVGMWGWAMRYQLEKFSWSTTPENQLITTGQNDWDKLFADEKTNLEKEKIKTNLKNVLNQLATTVASGSTTATTTVMTTTVPTTTLITTTSFGGVTTSAGFSATTTTNMTTTVK